MNSIITEFERRERGKEKLQRFANYLIFGAIITLVIMLLREL